MHYFGPWDDPDGALAKYLAEKDELHSGRRPKPAADAATVKDCVNSFLNHKTALLNAGEITSHAWIKYKDAADLVITQMGKARLAVDLDPADFARLRATMARRWGVYRLADMVQHCRSIFKHAFEVGLIPVPTRFGPGFERPSKKVMRLHKAQQGPKLFTAEEIRRLLGAATPPLRAMILLGINAGFGNSDCANLPQAAVELTDGWINYPRPKTGVARRCPLWPETALALRAVLALGWTARDPADAGLVFLNRRGQRWSRQTRGGPIVSMVGRLLRKLGVNGRKGLGFYTLRHTFRTVADESKDQPAVDFIMGHEVPHMSAVYRETISDARLRAVADHVRTWLFAEPAR
jgi:integrase